MLLNITCGVHRVGSNKIMTVKTQLDTAPRMTVLELSRTSAFSHLSPKQATWIMFYCQGYLDTGSFDPVAATKAAYNCANNESARTFAYQLMSHPKILICLNRFFGETPEQSFLDQVEQACFNKKLTVAQVEALKLYSNLKGWDRGFSRNHRVINNSADQPETDSPIVEAGTFDATKIETPASRVPGGATPLVDAQGIVRGYRTADGRYVQFSNEGSR